VNLAEEAKVSLDAKSILPINTLKLCEGYFLPPVINTEDHPDEAEYLPLR